MASPHDPIGGLIQNLVALQRLGNGLNREVQPLLRALFDDLAAQIAKLDPTAPDREAYRRLRLEKLLGEIEPLVGQTFEEVRKTLRQRLAEIGSQQADWAGQQLLGAVGSIGVDITTGRIGVNFMKSILDSQPFQGETLKGWADTQKAATIRRARRQIQLGMAQNETLDQIVRRLRGRSNGHGGFTSGVLGTTTRETEAIARTAINFVANRGHVETYRQNADVVKGLEVVAVLDSHTTFICMSKDGTVLPLDSSDLPPYHYGCRTVVVAQIDWKGLGIEPPDPGMRSSDGGPVKSSTTYEDWLKQQPAAKQDEILGPGRAKLFRDGKINLRDLVKQDRSIVTVDELRKKAGVVAPATDTGDT